MKEPICGGLPELINNPRGIYEGNLRHYARCMFWRAKNLTNPYHNFRHSFNVPWLCYEACIFYAEALTPREMRDLLIGALYHDRDHTGTLVDDDINIALAVEGLEPDLLEKDRGRYEQISDVIWATRYPYKVPSRCLPLSHQIIRDADMVQALNASWIQEVVFGLATEWEKEPIELLGMQESFISGLSFSTDWAEKLFPKRELKRKVKEAHDLFEIFKTKSSFLCE